MYVQKTEKEIRCPLDYFTAVLSGKWKMRIISILNTQGAERYMELHEYLGDITDTVLAATLKEMVADGLLLRRQYEEIPPRVEYALTEKSVSLVPVLETLCEWSCRYSPSDQENLMPQCVGCRHNDVCEAE